MALPYLSTLFFLSYLSLLNSAKAGEPTCPSSFPCQNLGSFTFPFYNSTDKRCGLCKLNCENSNPTVQVGEKGQSYVVKRWLQSDELVVYDQTFQHLLNSKSCDVFSSISFPNYPSLSFTISNNITLFKCAKVSEFSSIRENNFSGYYSYKKCNEYNLYYRYPTNLDANLVNPIAGCSVIQLPMPLPDLHPERKNGSDLFKLLSAEFPLQFDVSDDCSVCHDKGGYCQNRKQKFHCGYAGEGSPKKFFIGVTKVVACTLAGGLSITAVVVLCCCWSKCSKFKSLIWQKDGEKDHKMVEAMLKQHGPLAATRYRYQDIKKMTISFKYKLGQGGNGAVYKGILNDGRLVAVKILNKLKGSGEEFVNEVISSSKASHINVVTLLGFCYERSKRALIYEFMPNGSLDKFIYNEKSSNIRQLGWQKLYQIALGIARGLEYLHRGCNTRILHFDIKPHNILLDEEFCPKIADFGLAKLCFGKDSVISMLGMRGTPGYIAPEVFSRNFGGVSHKSDVYSYGMMILEMVGGRRNSDLGADRTSEKYFPQWIYNRLELDVEIGQNGIVSEVENECTRKMVMVGMWCIQTDPSNRPSMGKVLEMLEGSLEALQIPSKPFLVSSPKSLTDSSTT